MYEADRSISVNRADRQERLRRWYCAWSGADVTALEPVAGDASFRRYYRPRGVVPTLVLCDSPPDKEKNPEFLAIARGLEKAGVRVPRVLQADLELGFFALEDLGDQLLLPLLSRDSADTRYREALGMLCDLADAKRADFSVPDYDEAQLRTELGLFPDWFCSGLLGIELDEVFARRWQALEALLCARALAQPQVLVHRDFHARNLMVLADGSLATIDFQDAVWGPITYDPVSLLRDCYLRWPDAQVRDWALEHHKRLQARGIAMPPAAHYLTDFDWMGLQRHIKVLGIFSRLYLRDRKAAYLGDLSRVIGYVRDVLALYGAEPVLADFAGWFEGAVMPRARLQDWYRDA